MNILKSVFEAARIGSPSTKRKLSNADAYTNLISKLESEDECPESSIQIERRRQCSSETLTRLYLTFFAMLLILLGFYFYTIPTDRQCKRQISTWCKCLSSLVFCRA